MHPALLPPLALILPFIIWPIELFLPFPYIIEELAKLLLIKPLAPVKKLHQTLILAFTLGIFFTLSETVLYFVNPSYFFNLPLLLTRLLVTGLLHSLTTTNLALFQHRVPKLLYLGLLINILIHFTFNLLISPTS